MGDTDFNKSERAGGIKERPYPLSRGAMFWGPTIWRQHSMLWGRRVVRTGVANWAAAERSPSLSSVRMSISVGGGESYPGRSFSVSQLLYATKKKLENITLAEGCACTAARPANSHLHQSDRLTTSTTQAEVRRKNVRQKPLATHYNSQTAILPLGQGS